MTQDLYYIDEGYYDIGYFVYTADAEAAVATTSQIACTAGIIANGQASLEATFSQTAALSHIYGADLFAMSNASLAAEVSRIRDNNIAVAGVFSISTDASRTVNISASEDFAFSISMINARIRASEAAIDAAFSLAADAVRLDGGLIVEAYGTWTSSSSLDAGASLAKGLAANISSSLELTASISHIEGADLNAFNTASLSISLDKIVGNAVSLELNSQVSLTALRLLDFDSHLDLTASQVTSTSVNKPFDSLLASTVALTATISHIHGADLNAFNTAALTSSIDKFTGVSTSLTLSFNQTSTILRLKGFSLGLQATATLTSNATKLRTVNASLQSSSVLSSSAIETFNASRPFTLHRRFGPNLISLDPSNISTAQKKYGSASLFVQGYRTNNSTGELAEVNPNATTNPFFINSSQDFYISFWTYFSTGPTSASTSGIYSSILQLPGIDLGLRSTTFDSDPYLRAGSNFTIQEQTQEVSRNVWYRWEAYRIGSTVTFKFNNQIVGTATFSDTIGTFGSSGGTIRIGHQTNGFIPSNIYFDDIFISVGTNAVQNTKPSGEIFDGALTTTKLLYHFNGDAIDETTGLQNATASLSTSAVLSAAPENRTKDLSASLQSNGFLVSAAGRIRPFVDIEVATFSLDGSLNVIKGTEVVLSSSSSLNSLITKNIGTIEINASSTAQLTANYGILTAGSVELSSSSNLDAYLDLIKRTAANTSANFALEVQVLAAKVTDASLNVITSFNLTNDKLVSGTASLSSQINLQAIAGNTVPFISTPNSSFNLDCSLERIIGIASSLDTNSQLLANVTIDKTFTIGLASQITQIVIATSTRTLVISTESIASELVAISRILKPGASLFSQSQLVANASVISSRINADLVSNLELVVRLTRLAGLSSQQIASSQLQAQLGKVVNAQAGLTMQAFTLTVLSKVTFDPELTWKIPSENRYWKIPREINLDDAIVYLVPREIRNWTIPAENNYYVVEYEDRIYKIKGK